MCCDQNATNSLTMDVQPSLTPVSILDFHMIDLTKLTLAVIRRKVVVGVSNMMQKRRAMAKESPKGTAGVRELVSTIQHVSDSWVIVCVSKQRVLVRGTAWGMLSWRRTTHSPRPTHWCLERHAVLNLAFALAIRVNRPLDKWIT